MSRDEKRLARMLAVVLAMWVSESWHGIGPAWTGLAAAVITLLPRIGFINGEEFSTGLTSVPAFMLPVFLDWRAS